MRAQGWIFGCLLLAVASAGAQCGASPARVIDTGVRRQWLVERDCAHPERPAHLVEVPWSDQAAKGIEAGSLRATAANPRKILRRRSLPARPLLVRPGMRVMVVRQDQEVEVRLWGMALGEGAAGSMVRVRAGLGEATLCGVVRGPALVELVPEAEGDRCGS